MGNGPLPGETLRRSKTVRFRAASAALASLLIVSSAVLGLSLRRHPEVATGQRSAPDFTVSRNSRGDAPAKLDAQAILSQVPLIFEPNQGQADRQEKFLAHGAGYQFFLDAAGATVGVQVPATSSSPAHEQQVHIGLVGANDAAAVSGAVLLPGKSNYFLGSDRRQWHRDIPQFGQVKYQNIYPGVDLVFYGQQGHVEYDFKVAPGADPSQAEMVFAGATKSRLDNGDLILTGADAGGIRLQAPQAYQREGDRRTPVTGAFVLHAGNRVSFAIGPYDHSRELVIDPVLQFSTYFGGSGSETSPSVAVNGDGSIYLVGTTQGSPANTFPTITVPNLIPTTLALSTTSPSHIFVAKITPSQPPAVAYLTFLGGTGSDASVGLAVDGGGNAYIAGKTNSANFPTSGSPYQPLPETKTQCTGFPTCNSAFVTELDPLGSSLLYSSYLSGNGDDEPTGIAIDNNRDIFLTGTTTSVQQGTDQFPATQLPPAYQSTAKAPIQFFVTEINTNTSGSSSVAYSTYFGGAAVSGGTIATGGGITVDSASNIYFSGTTNFYNSGAGQYGNSGQTTDFPIINAYQPCLDTSPPTTTRQVSNPCTAPSTTPYPTDAFVAKINPNNAQTGTAQLLFSTYFGGKNTDSSTGISIDPGAANSGNIYITGTTNSTDFVLPTGAAAFQDCLNNPGVVVATTSLCPATTTNTDAYVARFSNPSTSTIGTPIDVGLTYFSYLGGALNDNGTAIAVDTASDAFITGSTDSTNFPVTAGAVQSTLLGAQNAFFAHIDTTATSGTTTNVGTYSTYFGGNGVDHGTSIAVDPVSQNAFFAGDTTSTAQFPTFDALQTTLNGATNPDAFVAELVPAADVTVAPVVSTVQSVGAGSSATVGFTVTNQGPDLATGIFVSGTVSAGVTLTSGTAGGGTCSPPTLNTVSCIIPTLQAGSPSTVSFSVTPTQAGSFEATAQVIKINNTNTNISAPSLFTAGSFNLSVSPSSRTVAAGQTAQYTVQLNPIGAFPGTVSLSVTGLPSATTSSFTSSSITFNGSSGASAVLNLITTPQPVTTAGRAQPPQTRHPLYAIWLLVPGIAFFGWRAGTRSKRWLGLLVLPLFLGLVLLQPSCSSGNKTQPPVSGTPSGTYTMTLTATSGSFSQTKTIQVTVTP